ncbi:MAG: pyruvate kinase [Chloroflexota bacterium]
MPKERLFRKRTKIVCTIGPATSSPALIERLIRAGADILRLNLSHGSYHEHATHVQAIRHIAGRLGKQVAILIDVPGPKYRTGKLRGGQAALRKGRRLVLTTRQVEGDATIVPVNLPYLPEDAKRGDTILLDDGAMELRVLEIDGPDVICRVVVGGNLTDGRGLVIPGMESSRPFVTDALRATIAFATTQEPDYIALSFVTHPEDIRSSKELIRDAGIDTPVVAKIERGQAVRNFDAILDASDSIMVARGDLGVDIPLEQLPIVQKDIIRKTNRAGKPVITATEMLESMVGSVRPTRAEVTDVANAIFDGTDATMLSAETSVGKYPVQAVRMMARVARAAEANLPYRELLTERSSWLRYETDELISYNACHTAQSLRAAAIVAFTQSGSTGGRVSKYRPSVPVLAISPSARVCRRLLLRWGIYPYQIAEPSSVDDLFATGLRLAQEHGLAKSGDVVVITGGLPIGMAGSTNLLKVQDVP